MQVIMWLVTMSLLVGACGDGESDISLGERAEAVLLCGDSGHVRQYEPGQNPISPPAGAVEIEDEVWGVPASAFPDKYDAIYRVVESSGVVAIDLAISCELRLLPGG